MTEAIAELGALEAMAVQGALEAMAGGVCGHGLGPSARPLQPEPFLPPPPRFPWEVRGGIRSPPGLNTDTGQDSPPGLDTQDKTVPQEQEALLG